MSANLMWAPAKRDAESLPDELKFVLRDKRGLTSDRAIFDSSEIPYLTALSHAGIEGADKLIEAIQKHGIVELWLEY